MRKNNHGIQFSTGVKYKGKYYLAAMHMNALFMYDELKRKLTFLMNFQKEEKLEALYLRSFLYKEEAWFIPCQADRVAIVNLEKLSIEYLPLLYHKEFHNTYIKYVNFICFKNKFLCLIPNDVDAVMIVNLENKKTKAYYEITEAEKNYFGTVFHDDKIYFFPWMEENILVLDLITNERVYQSWTEEKEAFGDAIYDETSGRIFHAPAKKYYVRVDSLHAKLYETIEFCDKNDKNYKTYYATDNKQGLFFWGNNNNIVLKANKENHSVKMYQIFGDSRGKCYCPICSDEIEALVVNGNRIIKYDMEKDKFYHIDINDLIDVVLYEINMSGIDIKSIVGNIENDFWKLRNLISYIQIKDNIKPCYFKTCAGDLIYKNSIT